MRLIMLDSGPLGMVANPRSKPRAVQCVQWARRLLAAGVRVIVPIRPNLTIPVEIQKFCIQQELEWARTLLLQFLVSDDAGHR